MTTQTAPRPAAQSPADHAGEPVRPGRGRRWLRLVLPPAGVLLLVVTSMILYWYEQPDRSDKAFLSPVSGADIGGRVLADRVRAGGITIDRHTRTSDALVAANRGNSTLLITTPDFVNPYYLRMLKLLPASTRVVLVEPGPQTLADGRVPAGVVDRTIAPRTAEPACDLPAARAAGRAVSIRNVYRPVVDATTVELHRCYSDSLVVVRKRSVELTLVGSADPFRNDRINEFNNAKLAVGLLSQAPRLVWLDLHRREPPPVFVDDPALAGGHPAPPSLGPGSGSPDPDFPIRGGSRKPAPAGEPEDQAGNGTADGRNPLTEAFPPWTYVAVLLVALALVLLAAARARRLGGPVSEPLPVVVRASETVVGRGRLYQRVRARGAALETLQADARQRMAHVLRLDPDPDRATLVGAVATYTSVPAEAVDATLFGPFDETNPSRPRIEPADDAALVRAAVALEALLNAVTAPEGDHR